MANYNFRLLNDCSSGEYELNETGAWINEASGSKDWDGYICEVLIIINASSKHHMRQYRGINHKKMRNEGGNDYDNQVSS